MVGEGNTDFKLSLAAKTRLDGGREVFVSGLDIFSDTVEGCSLFNSIVTYLTAVKPVAAPADPPRKIRVACIGDAITWGYTKSLHWSWGKR